ncbi:MAG: cupin domain-containing protein [Sphingomonas sp.]|uniref:cupin domain-containing protein n=1 Tax=Sphingomonas sp. TaxID=28214 RepID=UPI002614C5D4|nr:cupin domain-containing protein [Sphingomonas sp.]MDK2766095.1 cupin domain-containing protein [Sphingomonas sp.]
MHHVDWAKMEWKNVRKGVDRKAFTGELATIALHRLHPGEHEPFPHAHENEQILYIIEGTVDCIIGDECTRLGPGGIAVVPPNIVHSLKIIGNETVLNLDIFAPARPEYAE